MLCRQQGDHRQRAAGSRHGDSDAAEDCRQRAGACSYGAVAQGRDLPAGCRQLSARAEGRGLWHRALGAQRGRQRAGGGRHAAMPREL